MADEQQDSSEQLDERKRKWQEAQETQQQKREAFMRHLVLMAQKKTEVPATVWLPATSIDVSLGGAPAGRAHIRFYYSNGLFHINDTARGNSQTLFDTSETWAQLNRIFDEEERLAREQHAFALLHYEIGDEQYQYFLYGQDQKEAS